MRDAADEEREVYCN